MKEEIAAIIKKSLRAINSAKREFDAGEYDYACSRAKQNFYVVGNHKLWASMGNMKIVSQYVKIHRPTQSSGVNSATPLSR